MYQKILHFIKYHNAVTIVFVVVFFGFGVSYAASPAVRDAVYSSAETVVSVDNSLIASADLDNFNFNLVINSVTEDDKNYYADYSYQTLAIVDGVWQNKAMEKTLKVSKEALDGKDFGLYAAKELGENVKYELSFLKRVQKLEKEKGVSQKMVAVAYSGLIGKLLNPKERIIMGYSPVIKEVSKPEKAIVVHPPSRPSDSVETSAGQEAAVVAEPISTPAVETTATTTPEIISEPITEATTTPEIIPEPVIEATSTPEAAPEPEPVVEATTTPEIIPELITEATTTPEAAPQPSPEATAGTAEPIVEATSTTEVAPGQ